MKKKVLIIEDDSDTLEILAYIAEDMNVALELSAGMTSLAKIKEINPDLILTDHWIKDGNGHDLCLEIKNEPSTAHIPVVLISAHLQLPRLAQECRANAYLAKPFDIEDLQELIGKYVAE